MLEQSKMFALGQFKFIALSFRLHSENMSGMSACVWEIYLNEYDARIMHDVRMRKRTTRAVQSGAYLDILRTSWIYRSQS